MAKGKNGKMNKAERLTYYKRTRALLKKGIEISKKCDQDVLIAIFDKKTKKLVELNTTPDFNIQTLVRISQDMEHLNHQKFCNADYDLLRNNLTPLQFEKIETETIHQKSLRLEARPYENAIEHLGGIVHKLQKTCRPISDKLTENGQITKKSEKFSESLGP